MFLKIQKENKIIRYKKKRKRKALKRKTRKSYETFPKLDKRFREKVVRGLLKPLLGTVHFSDRSIDLRRQSGYWARGRALPGEATGRVILSPSPNPCGRWEEPQDLKDAKSDFLFFYFLPS